MSSILEKLFFALPELRRHHAPGGQTYQLLKQVARREIEYLFSTADPVCQDFPPFGSLTLPYYKMGAVDSLNLFDLDELIIFCFYSRNRNKYRKVADIGANVGLHSILLCKSGFEVRSYEPDPQHFSVFQNNMRLNSCGNIEAHNTAVSNTGGEMEFVRVEGNSTGSHLAGSKPNPYGELKRFQVRVESIESIIGWADLIKLDAEGHEKQIILSTKRADWLETDALIEVENSDNAGMLFEHLSKLGVNLFSQKTGWNRVRQPDQMPASYREGTLFASCKEDMPW